MKAYRNVIREQPTISYSYQKVVKGANVLCTLPHPLQRLGQKMCIPQNQRLVNIPAIVIARTPDTRYAVPRDRQSESWPIPKTVPCTTTILDAYDLLGRHDHGKTADRVIRPMYQVSKPALGTPDSFELRFVGEEVSTLIRPPKQSDKKLLERGRDTYVGPSLTIKP